MPMGMEATGTAGVVIVVGRVPWLGGVDQRVVPNKAPTAAVRAMASAPQKVTRATDLPMEEPPAWAATAPGRARKSNEQPETDQVNAARGTKKTSRSGSTAPTVKLPAEAKAACTGRAIKVSEMPNSSRAWAPIESAGDVDGRELGVLVLTVRGQLFALPFQIRALGVGLRTHGNIFPGGHRHRSRLQSRHASDEHAAAAGFSSSHSDNQTGGGNDAVIGSEHRGSQPAYALGAMTFSVAHRWRNVDGLSWMDVGWANACPVILVEVGDLKNAGRLWASM